MDEHENITDAEWLVMRALWSEGGAGAGVARIAEIVRRERDVSVQTVKTLLRRLIDKRCVGHEPDPEDSRAYIYRALIAKDDAVHRKNEAFLSKVHQKSAGEFVAHFVESGGMSREELLSLQRMVEEKLHGSDSKSHRRKKG